MKGNDIVTIIEEWLSKSNVHPDDFSMMTAEELLDLLAVDK